MAAWIRQVQIAKRVMRLSGEDVSDLASLSLRDKVFAVYEEMNERDKSDFDRIAEALLTAFAEDPLAAHVALRDWKCLVGEGVDTFLNELKRLGGIAGASDMTVKMDFITGLPRRFRIGSGPSPRSRSYRYQRSWIWLDRWCKCARSGSPPPCGNGSSGKKGYPPKRCQQKKSVTNRQ